jgi:hypothetical protein
MKFSAPRKAAFRFGRFIAFDMQPGSFLLTSRLFGQPLRFQARGLGALGFALGLLLGHCLGAFGGALLAKTFLAVRSNSGFGLSDTVTLILFYITATEAAKADSSGRRNAS